MNFPNSQLIRELFQLIELKNYLIAVESPVQERMQILKDIVNKATIKSIDCYLWAMESAELQQLVIDNSGMLTLQTKHSFNQPKGNKFNLTQSFEILNYWRTSKLSGILILEGVFPWLKKETDDPDFFLIAEWIKSALLNLKLHDPQTCQTTVLLGPNATLSYEMAAEIPIVAHNLPTILQIVDYLVSIFSSLYNTGEIYELAFACVGMYFADIDRGIRTVLFNRQLTGQELAQELSKYKINLLRQVYGIEFLQPSVTKIGGLELIQESFIVYKRLYGDLANRYKLKPPKGVLLIGPPGTGKSHSAKACSQHLGFPLIIVEWGNFRSYGHLAEYRLKQLLALVDRIDRIIFYLDDFDKGFAGDNDLSRRLAAMLLTWMQERTSNVLIIASANSLENLPPELTRCGRFDDIFKVDLPNAGERHQILKIHLARFDSRFQHGDPYSQEEWQKILKHTQRCVGAELQTIVQRAAADTFFQMHPSDSRANANELPPLEIPVQALLDARTTINPLAIREANKIERLRNQASLQGLPSSPPDSSIYRSETVNIFG
jgi:hypothetical protein